MIYLAGYYANALRRATSFRIPAAGEHPLYPATNLSSGRPSSPFKTTILVNYASMDADINFLLNQGLEDWGVTTLPDDWTKGSGAGSIAQEASIVFEGSYSCKITGAKNIYQDVFVLPGKRYQIAAAVRGDGSNAAYVQVRNLDSHNWLTSAGTWQATAASCMIQTPASWDPKSVAFTVEESTAFGHYPCRLRIFCTSNAGTGVYFDDMHLIPYINFCSIHGHNIGPTCAVYGSTDNFDTSNDYIGSMTPHQPAFYTTFTEQLYRYWRFQCRPDSLELIWIGEWVLGHYNTLGQTMKWGWSVQVRQPQTRVAMSPSGQLYSRREAYRPSRDLVMEFMAETEADRDEVLEQVLEASEWADEPLIIVPDTSDELVVHGRVGETFPYTNDEGPTWGYGVTVHEDAFPVAGF